MRDTQPDTRSAAHGIQQLHVSCRIFASQVHTRAVAVPSQELREHSPGVVGGIAVFGDELPPARLVGGQPLQCLALKQMARPRWLEHGTVRLQRHHDKGELHVHYLNPRPIPNRTGPATEAFLLRGANGQLHIQVQVAYAREGQGQGLPVTGLLTLDTYTPGATRVDVPILPAFAEILDGEYRVLR